MQISKVGQSQNFGKFTLIKGIYAFPKITPKRQRILDKITKNFNVTADTVGVEIHRPNMLYLREANLITFIPHHPEKATIPRMAIRCPFNSKLPDNKRFSQLVEAIKESISTFNL